MFDPDAEEQRRYWAGIRRRRDPSHPAVAAFAAAWVSVETAAIVTSLELALSDTSPLDVALPAMVGVHALIGIGEGLITAAALGFIMSTRADLLPDYVTQARTPAAAARS